MLCKIYSSHSHFPNDSFHSVWMHRQRIVSSKRMKTDRLNWQLKKFEWAHATRNVHKIIHDFMVPYTERKRHETATHPHSLNYGSLTQRDCQWKLWPASKVSEPIRTIIDVHIFSLNVNSSSSHLPSKSKWVWTRKRLDSIHSFFLCSSSQYAILYLKRSPVNCLFDAAIGIQKCTIIYTC